MVDILTIAAHPDDIELNVAGTLLKALDNGRTIGLCDVTAGERGSRGSAEIRAAETRAANRVFGIDDELRWNLGIPDGDVRITTENITSVVRAIRYFRPSVLLLPWHHDRHPDHEAVHQLVRRAYFDAGLVNVETEWNGTAQEPHRPTRLFTFFQSYEARPDFIVDVSDQFERKLDAIAAYSSQVSVPGRTEPHSDGVRTFISGPDFMEFIVARMRHWGFMIGTRYGEAFGTVGMPVAVRNLMDTV